MSLIQFAQNKDAISFKAALEEKIQERVDASLNESKIEIASHLFEEPSTGAGIPGGIPKVLPNVEKMPLPPKGVKLPAKPEGEEAPVMSGDGVKDGVTQ